MCIIVSWSGYSVQSVCVFVRWPLPVGAATRRTSRHFHQALMNKIEFGGGGTAVAGADAEQVSFGGRGGER